MAHRHPLADLLNQAGEVFSDAGNLARSFQDEQYPDWRRHDGLFREFTREMLALQNLIKDPPDGFDKIAKQLREAGRVAKEIRDTQPFQVGSPAYRLYAPDLNTVARDGWQAVTEANKTLRLDDEFAFLGELATSPADEPAAAVEPEKNPVGNNNQFPPITKDDREILLYLFVNLPETCIQVDVSSATGIEKKLVRKRMEYLRDNNLTHRPNGPRKGDTLTDLGITLARNLDQRESEKEKPGC